MGKKSKRKHKSQFTLSKGQGPTFSGASSGSTTSYGDYDDVITAGEFSNARTTGEGSDAVALAQGSKAKTSGDNSHATTLGKDSKAKTTGRNSHAVTSRYGSQSKVTGLGGYAVALGAFSKAIGKTLAAALGPDGMVSGTVGTVLIVIEWSQSGVNERKPIAAHTFVVDGVKILPGCLYRLDELGKLEIVEGVATDERTHAAFHVQDFGG